MWVRFPPLELTGRASRPETAPRSKRDEAQALEGSTPSPSAHVSLAEWARHRAPNPITRVRLPQDTLGDRLTVGQRSLKSRMKVRFLLPEPHANVCVRVMRTDSGVVEWPQRLALNEERSVRFRPPVLLQGPGTPTGRAARLKPERVWVRLPPWVLVRWFRRVRKLAKRSSSNLGDRLRVRLPPLRLKICVGWALASPSGRNPPALLCRFNSCPTH